MFKNINERFFLNKFANLLDIELLKLKNCQLNKKTKTPNWIKEIVNINKKDYYILIFNVIEKD